MTVPSPRLTEVIIVAKGQKGQDAPVVGVGEGVVVGVAVAPGILVGVGVKVGVIVGVGVSVGIVTVTIEQLSAVQPVLYGRTSYLTVVPWGTDVSVQDVADPARTTDVPEEGVQLDPVQR